MRAAIFDAPFAIRMAEAQKPEPQAGEVLVRVKAAGLCAGDLYIYTGKNPYVSYPRIGCHEIAGIVESYGPGASGPAVGTRVVVDPFIGCGHCYPCRVGRRNCCANLTIVGVHRRRFRRFRHRPGRQFEYRAQDPDAPDFEAAFAEPVAIGVQGCRRGMSPPTTPYSCSVPGRSDWPSSKWRGRTAPVCATDISAERLATAADLGAAPITGGDGLLERVLDIAIRRRMPVVMEATMRLCNDGQIDLVAAGRRFVILGLVKKART